LAIITVFKANMVFFSIENVHIGDWFSPSASTLHPWTDLASVYAAQVAGQASLIAATKAGTFVEHWRRN